MTLSTNELSLVQQYHINDLEQHVPGLKHKLIESWRHPDGILTGTVEYMRGAGIFDLRDNLTMRTAYGPRTLTLRKSARGLNGTTLYQADYTDSFGKSVIINQYEARIKDGNETLGLWRPFLVDGRVEYISMDDDRAQVEIPAYLNYLLVKSRRAFYSHFEHVTDEIVATLPKRYDMTHYNPLPTTPAHAEWYRRLERVIGQMSPASDVAEIQQLADQAAEQFDTITFGG